MFGYFRAPVPWTALAKRTVAEIVEDDCAGLAAQLAFCFLLAVFPALLFLVALLSYVPVDAALESTLRQWDAMLPSDVVRLIRDQLREVVAGNSGSLLTFGIVGSSARPIPLGYPLHYAAQEPLPEGGRRIVLATDRPISFSETWHSARTLNYPFTVIEL